MKAKTKPEAMTGSERQRVLKETRESEGWRHVSLWLEPAAVAKLDRIIARGEVQAHAINRLIAAGKVRA